MSEAELILGEVVAIGTAVTSKIVGLGEMIEKAMVEAILACHARGVTTSDEILKAKNEAFEATKAAYETYLAAMKTSEENDLTG